MVQKHKAVFEDFSRTIPHATLEKWKADVERWEEDPSKSPDPFVERATCEIIDILSVIRALNVGYQP